MVTCKSHLLLVLMVAERYLKCDHSVRCATRTSKKDTIKFRKSPQVLLIYEYLLCKTDLLEEHMDLILLTSPSSGTLEV